VHGPKNDLKELKKGQYTRLIGVEHPPSNSNYLDTLEDADEGVVAQ
jgi:hypothetical protein